METTNDNREILPGVDSKYNFKYYKFPTDLTQSYNNHYMIIQINVPAKFGYAVRGNFPITGTTGELSKVDELNSITNNVLTGGASRFVSSEQARRQGRVGGIGLTDNPYAGTYDPLKMGPTSRGTTRISDAIALFMPTPIIYNTINDYEEVKLTQLFGQGIAALAGAASARNASAAGASIADAQAAGASASGAVDAFGRVVGTASKMFGYPINPRVEVLFSNTKLRQYVFEFLLAPTSEEESKVISNIIRTLRFHAAPELEAFGTFFIPPAEFDITFYHNGKENLALPRINTCILDRIEVDYTPQQGMYASFSNGHPVTTRLSLGLREVEIIHKTRVYQGF
jgi:hypothetical protein